VIDYRPAANPIHHGRADNRADDERRERDKQHHSESAASPRIGPLGGQD
jgi:hypothetical protein